MSEAQTLTQEQAALLAHVSQTEAQINAGQIIHDDQGNPVEPEPTIEDKAGENAAILGAIIGVLTPVLPFLPDCYSKETIQKIAFAYTAVEEKRGWNVKKFLSVEMQLAIVAIPPTIGAVMIGRAYFAAMKQRMTEETAGIEKEEEKPSFISWFVSKIWNRKKVENGG